MSVTTTARQTAIPAIRTLNAAVIVRWLPLAAICALPVALYAPYLTEPFFRDEGSYAAVAQWMLDGRLPYAHSFDNKPPMIYAYYAASFVLFGENVWAPRLLVALMLSGATALMYAEGRLLYGHRGGLVAALAFALAFGLGSVQTSANTEFFMIPAAVASLVAFTVGRRYGQSRWYVAAGAFAGVSVATKPVSLFIPLLYVLVLAADHLRAAEGRGVRPFARSLACLGGGVGAAALVVTGPFVLTGNGPELFEATVRYALVYVGDVPLSDKLDAVRIAARHFTLITLPWGVLALIGAGYVMRRGLDGWGPLVIGFFFANLCGIAAAGRFYNHYFITVMPALALLVPLGVRALAGLWQRPAGKVLVLGYLPLTLILPVINAADVYAHSTPAERHVAKYEGDGRAPWENASEEFGAWVRARTSPDDTIWNYGFQSELYFYADRRSPTRFFMDRPLWNSDEYTRQALAELDAERPLYVFDSLVYEDWTGNKKYRPEVKAWIQEHYDYQGRYYYADVYRLKGAGDGYR